MPSKVNSPMDRRAFVSMAFAAQTTNPILPPLGQVAQKQ
jgi:hypothetical protein